MVSIKNQEHDMLRMTPLMGVAIVFGLFVSLAHAEVVTIDGTIKSVDAKKRTITIDTGSKTLTLDVSSKAKISVDEKDASLDSLKPGQQVGLSYHDKLEVVLKIVVTPKNRLSPVGTWVEKRPGTPAGKIVRTFRKDGTLIVSAPKLHKTSKGTWRIEGKRVYFRQESDDSTEPPTNEKWFEIIEIEKDYLRILMVGKSPVHVVQIKVTDLLRCPAWITRRFRSAD